MVQVSLKMQLTVLALFGVGLTVAASGLTLARSWNLAFTAKQAEIRHLVESAASLIETFVDLEKSGALSTTEAQSRALATVAKLRFDGDNSFFVSTYDFRTLVSPNKNLIGKDRRDDVDVYGNLVIRPMVENAKAGHPQFSRFYWPKLGSATPIAKMTHGIAIPESQLSTHF